MSNWAAARLGVRTFSPDVAWLSVEPVRDTSLRTYVCAPFERANVAVASSSATITVFEMLARACIARERTQD